jgi:hypothetical protein
MAGVRGCERRLWRDGEEGEERDVATRFADPLTLTLSRRERGPGVKHFAVASQFDPLSGSIA